MVNKFAGSPYCMYPTKKRMLRWWSLQNSCCIQTNRASYSYLFLDFFPLFSNIFWKIIEISNSNSKKKQTYYNPCYPTHSIHTLLLPLTVTEVTPSCKECLTVNLKVIATLRVGRRSHLKLRKLLFTSFSTRLCLHLIFRSQGHCRCVCLDNSAAEMDALLP